MVEDRTVSDTYDDDRIAIENKLQVAIEQVVSLYIGPNVRLVKETDLLEKKPGGGGHTSSGGSTISNDNLLPDASNTNLRGKEEETGNEMREARLQATMSRGLLTSPKFYIKLAQTLTVTEGEKLDQHLPPNYFVSWEVLVRTIHFYVRASSI